MTQNLRDALARRLEALSDADVIRRVWERDPTVWVDDPATPELKDRLGWLSLFPQMRRDLHEVTRFAEEVREEFDRVILLGMGGSSLAPEVMWRTFGRNPRFPPFQMLDSTAPEAVIEVERGGDPGRTLYIVASKSGTTLETMSFFRYFWRQSGGRGDHFVAITDGDTPLARLGAEQRFRRVFLNPTDIGGRYSALSLFGLVPAALMGVDVGKLLDRGEEMARRCGPDVPVESNPGAWLGALMAETAIAGRDKLTLVLTPGIAGFGLWVEQLVAESTGKGGKGIVPVVMEPPRAPGHYVDHRLFVVQSLGRQLDPRLERWMHAVARNGHPVAWAPLDDPYDLGGEFFCWEFATAVAGAVLRINPFNQPDVAESKQATKRVLAERRGLDPVAQLRRHDITAFLEGVSARDYVAVLAYHAPSKEADERVAAFAGALRDRLAGVVTWGYGPRYLHSTGQLHKGGPPTGHFVQLVGDAAVDRPVPGEDYSFGELLRAQALGDYEALVARKRPVLRVTDPESFLEQV
ncbi:MAG: glucose-6-phosphate isomerase [Gemmatimonadota bacterium]|nr:MAG: glucose-6-phosphate isomerase [Gemmatimonadota bacterium]